jgi:hypothetical protein
MTGYPLPIENIGGKNMEVLLEDMKNRIVNLDPSRKYREKHNFIIREKLGKLPEKSDHPLTITFAVGGAGAQKEIGVELARRLKKIIYSGRMKIVLVAGTKRNIKENFEKELRNGGLGEMIGSGIEIVYGSSFEEYYDKFNLVLRKTDILWTKPSELSFYAALGLPVIIAPTIGSQEEYNKAWLLKSGFGVEQREIGHVKEWLYDWLEEGYFADMAMEGFISGEKMGTFKIKEQIQK